MCDERLAVQPGHSGLALVLVEERQRRLLVVEIHAPHVHALGVVAQNALEHGAAALNSAACRICLSEERGRQSSGAAEHTTLKILILKNGEFGDDLEVCARAHGGQHAVRPRALLLTLVLGELLQRLLQQRTRAIRVVLRR